MAKAQEFDRLLQVRMASAMVRRMRAHCEAMGVDVSDYVRSLILVDLDKEGVADPGDTPPASDRD